ncbi:MAG: bifunctional phosphopantothenoylcysteine decarboxylase/phosphopantothenate--cysteine ligase CoaBC [Microbacteriaceae bacterium]|nr:bifunctional phosphopantothenoylcysteine decarboxylase/phosphopantothenate--cysteine ligase CoaBC [Microbacteriaceae bacterium]
MKPAQVVVGITGGIAVYKAVNVVRQLVLAGHNVRVIATENALKFVGKPTLEAISRNPINVSVFDDVAQVRHVELGQSADLVVVAPATASRIARTASGLADDLLANTLLVTTAPILFAPAMHTEMWENPATVANINILKARGINLVGPASGALTGADVGVGRMAEPEDIVAVASMLLSQKDLSGKKILVTAGGTQEPIDPVRFIGNRSSGKQGVALANAAALRGASVTLLAANIDPLLSILPGIEVVKIATAEQLFESAKTCSQSADAVIMAAAVADFTPVNVAENKIKKTSGQDEMLLTLKKTPDILKHLASNRAPNQVVIGFAAETVTTEKELLELAKVKVRNKGADYIVANSVGWDKGFSEDANEILMVSVAGDIVAKAQGTKTLIANVILDILK